MTVVIVTLVVILLGGQSTAQAPKSYKAPITSGASRMDPKEVWAEKFATEHELQAKRLDAMEKMMEALLKLNDGAKKIDYQVQGQPLAPKLQPTSIAIDAVDDLRNAIQKSEEPANFFSAEPVQQGGSSPLTTPTPPAPVTQALEKKTRFRSKGIQRTSLMLVKSKSNLKSADNTIPAGAFAGAVMVGGVDASTSIQASNDPRPVLLRVTDHGTLPRKFKSDLCGCHVLAACYGDISSERVYMRLEKLTCTERKTGEVVEMQVNGYVAGEDGRAGLRGVVVDRAGESMRNAAIGGFLSGMGNFLSQSHSPVTFSPANGLAQTNPMTNPDMLKFGAAKGASGALDKYADFYIKRAEQMQPVIQVQAGRRVDIVFTQGVAFENSAARGEMIRVNDQQRLNQLQSSSDVANKPVEAWIPNQSQEH